MIVKLLQKVGNAARTVQGWAWIFTGLPPAVVFVVAFLEDQPWSGIVFITTATFAYAVVAVYCFIGLWDHITGKLTKRRIIKALQGYAKSGFRAIDLPTAAAIWAGTMEVGSIERHMCFRKLKGAIRSGKLPSFGNVPKPNIKTHVLIDDLIEYFRKIDS